MRRHTRFRGSQGRGAVGLLVPVGDAAAREVVGRELDADTVADEDADAVLAHLPGNLREHDVFAVVYLNHEEGVGLLINHHAGCWNEVFFSQSLVSLSIWVGAWPRGSTRPRGRCG